MTDNTSLMNKGKTLKSENERHRWNFSFVGGVNRVNLNSGLDIVSLEHLDQKLWTALSCPVKNLELDAKTLELVDTDQNNRINVPEVIEAVNWLVALIKNPDELTTENKTLPLSAINTDTEEGKNLFESAQQVLINLGKANINEISKNDTSNFTAIFANTKFNGDGIITEISADNEELKKIISRIINLIGSVTDRNGNLGINLDLIEQFYQKCIDYVKWNQIAEENPNHILPIADKTHATFEILEVLKDKIEDYFLRSQMMLYDSNSGSSLNALTTQLEALNAKNLSENKSEIANLPLAKSNSNLILNFNEGINPAWQNQLNNFKNEVFNVLFPNKSQMTLNEWEFIKQKFIPFNNWLNEKKCSVVESLGILVIKDIVNNSRKDELIALINKDLEYETESNYIYKVDKLVRFYCELPILLRNFVNFSDFYNPKVPATFQSGQLYIDQRCCELCIRVIDMDKHNLLATNSYICLLYCDCFSKVKNEKMTIVAALTDGDLENITVGRNAVFYDNDGNCWDATVIKIIDHPISIRQAFWSPYKKISKFISTQIENLASSKEKDIEAISTSSLEKTTMKIDTGIKESITSQPPKDPKSIEIKPEAAKPAPFDIGRFVGIFAAISLAMGAIGSVLMSFIKGFIALTWWKMPLALLGIMLAISLPAMVLAYLKLRKRNLAPVLDANGWAINSKITINILFGKTLTQLAEIPLNSNVNFLDPFSKKNKYKLPILIGSIAILAVLIFVAWKFGWIQKLGIFN